MKRILVIIYWLLVIGVLISCQNEEQAEYNRYYANGASVYQSHCQNCHGDKGQGLAALIPPLTDTLYLKNNKHMLACYLQNGLKGKIQVDKREFDSQMPAATLSNIEMAQVITYITNSFGNQGGLVTNDHVAHDLKGCK